MAASLKELDAGIYVSCPTCACEIPVAGTRRLPNEFSVPCPNCGERRVYRADDVHDLKQSAAANMKSRNINFSTKKRSVQSKSWLPWL
jgi:predicted RNA-binding Zn-ribbon protein involved in translation (DUF1610 family)